VILCYDETKKMHNLFADTQCLVEEQNLEAVAAAAALWLGFHNLPPGAAGTYGFSGGNQKIQVFASFATNRNTARVKIAP
jgi:hypothetical protein